MIHFSKRLYKIVDFRLLSLDLNNYMHALNFPRPVPKPLKIFLKCHFDNILGKPHRFRKLSIVSSTIP